MKCSATAIAAVQCNGKQCNALEKLPRYQGIEMRSAESDLPRLEYFPETPIFNIQFRIAISKIPRKIDQTW